MFKPRPAQKLILDYTQGKMGIKAVPGSGKTHTLSYLAAKLILDNRIADDQEILIVTLVNSAVDNFSSRVSSFISSLGMFPQAGYRVRTLHGLANDIVKERPDLAGLSDDFQILDERETNEILSSAVRNWIRVNPDFIEGYSSSKSDLKNLQKISRNWHDLLINTAGSFIRLAKDYQYDVDRLQTKLTRLNNPHILLTFGCEIFHEYQRALHYRSAIDFDDLIRLALRALESDPDFLLRLKYRWPYILEDEAQDSSRLQEKILEKLAGEDGNWVRVGDPNQAIFETFTTAHPKFLLDFIAHPNTIERELPNSGRSTYSIIDLANSLIHWSRSEDNPQIEIQSTLTLPYIDPTSLDDPQVNPPDNIEGITLYENKLTPEKEISLVTKSVRNWLKDNPDRTVAILVPRNERGAKIVEALNKLNIPTIELLRSSKSTRSTAELFAAVLFSLSDPGSSVRLSVLYKMIRQFRNLKLSDEDILNRTSKIIRDCRNLEEYLWPHASRDWITELKATALHPKVIDELEWFRPYIRRWQNAITLPIDQLVLTISQDLFTEPIDLAISHKLAVSVGKISQNHQDWLLPDFAQEMDAIAKNRRKFLGFTSEDNGFEPGSHKGEVVVSTIHKAKGLEWDRVYLLSINDYDFPFGFPDEDYIGEKYFVLNRLNLQEETTARLKCLLEDDLVGLHLDEGEATRTARIEYAKERLRLFFVGITRAKSELIITWNTGQRGKSKKSVPFLALIKNWKEKNNVN